MKIINSIYQNFISRTTSKNIWKSIPIFIIGLLLTFAVATYTKHDVESQAKREFTLIGNEIKSKIITRLYSHAQLLRSGSAFFEASEIVTRKEWKAFYELSKLNKNLPGIQGFGFSLIIPKNQLQRHIEQVRKEGFPEYNIRPRGDREIYTSIIYLEPFADRNLRAFGYDMYQEPIRRKAMDEARDFDIAALSGKVVLVQETDKDLQAGTLMYVPVYRKGLPTTTVEERRAAIIGWVYSPYRMHDLMQGILGQWDLNDNNKIRLHIFDNDTISQESLLFDSQRNDTIIHEDSALSLTIPIVFNDKKWTLQFSQPKEQLSTLQSKVLIVLISGLIISILLFSLFLSVFNTRFRAEQIAEELTSELKESENRFSLFMDHLPAIVFLKDNDGKTLFVNKYMDDAVGASKWIGKNMLEIFPNEFGEKLLTEDLRVLKSGYEKIEESIIQSDGKLHYFETQKFIIPRHSQENFLGGISLDITERKYAEQVLRESEEKFRVTFENSPIGVINRSLDGHILSVNQSFCDMIGYSHEELLSMKFMDFTHPDSIDQSNALIKRLLDGEISKGIIEKKYICKDGRVVWGNLSSTLFYKEDGSPEYFINTVQDITERKQLENELLESEARFRAMFEKHNAIMLLIESETGSIIDANNSACVFYGYSESQLCGMSINEINTLPPEQIVFERKKAIEEKRNYFIFHHKLANGDERVVEVHSSPIRFQKMIILFSIIHDITDRRKLEEQLIQLAVEKQTILDNIATAVFFLKHRKVIWANKNAVNLFGYTLEEMIGGDTSKFYLSKEAFENFGHKAYPILSNGSKYSNEEKLITKTKEIIWAALTGQAINPIDQNEGTIWIIDNITKRKYMEEKIQVQNKELAEVNASKDKFFSIIAHDLKNPFMGFVGLTELMLNSDISLGELRDMSTLLNKSANNLSKLLENLLTWARMQRGAIEFKPEHYILSNVVSLNINLVTENAKQKNIEIIDKISTDLKVFADLSMLDTVFRNLISNAIKFTPRGGKIIISAEKKDNEILIAIQDTGIGMNEKILNGIFRIDQKTSRPGTEKESSTGLGLLLCKDFIEKHNGKIWAESEEDKGSTFYFTLGDGDVA